MSLGEKITIGLISFQTLVLMIELAVTLDKKFKIHVDNVLHIPEEDREP